MHENNPKDTLRPEEPSTFLKFLKSMQSADGNLGQVPGAFKLPICRNPGGEAISSVWSNKGRNFPCKCGEVPWKQERYNSNLDQNAEVPRAYGVQVQRGLGGLLQRSQPLPRCEPHQLELRGRARI
ncbi:hypothetical protein BU23DRAFT_551306 [Bimuria novae-zelandiae CBS 107.79]|uniref:Uncharacterized protein n=1 Tax=Bimuria novae-zelandiae CBS 107.79 TaxID=1447943 RepID=A0A6A5VMD1_9PLEO|nr:hypothetical protein BU23DRAFT_551306 [Bimuria novae-zelandiae CBS 107.79]